MLTILKTFSGKIFEFIKKNPSVTMIVIIAILIILLLKQCGKNKDLEDNANQNYHALHDTVVKYVNRDGEVSFQKAIMIMSKDDLKKYNPELYKELNKEKGVRIITKTSIEYRDTGSVRNNLITLGNDQYSLPFNYTSSDSVLTIKGNSDFKAVPFLDGDKAKLTITPGLTTFTENKIQFSLKVGIKKDPKDGLEKIFVTPSSDKLVVTKIEGADVSKQVKPKKFGVGAFVGYGICLSKGGVYYGPSLGISLSYNFLRF